MAKFDAIEGYRIGANDVSDIVLNAILNTFKFIAEQKPDYCHHEVDLSGCSEEYRKGYYDGWNNCNQQHSQLEAEQKPAEWSEEDEKTSKEIINFLVDMECKGDWIAYLEKQKEPIPIPDKFSGLKSLLLQYLQSAANRKDDAEIEDDTDLWGRKILDYVWKQDDEQPATSTNLDLTQERRNNDTSIFRGGCVAV